MKNLLTEYLRCLGYVEPLWGKAGGNFACLSTFRGSAHSARGCCEPGTVRGPLDMLVLDKAGLKR